MTTLRIRRPDDMHVHLREGDMLNKVVGATANVFGRALVMPNTTKPILTARDVVRYREEILFATPVWFKPLMTIKLVPGTSPTDIVESMAVGAIAGKLYPEGVTTNSQDGVRDLKGMYPVFAAMEIESMVLSLHGESPSAFCLDREAAFLKDLVEIVQTFPKLRVVLEHITTADAVELVEFLPATVAATITVHHLYLTLDDVIGGMLNPHNFCKPIAKTPEDRGALIQAVLSGNPKFFLGTDSAPHDISKKHCASGCAGVYSAPVAMQVLPRLFENFEELPKLEAFTSEFGARFYNLPLNVGELVLVEEDWNVPETYAGIVPFKAGETLPWKLV